MPVCIRPVQLERDAIRHRDRANRRSHSASPGAHSKKHPDLNCAYAFSVSDSITEVLTELREALESNGFTTAEAARLIIPVPQGTLPLGVQPKTLQLSPTEIDSAVAEVQVAALAGKARIDAAKAKLPFLSRSMRMIQRS